MRRNFSSIYWRFRSWLSWQLNRPITITGRVSLLEARTEIGNRAIGNWLQVSRKSLASCSATVYILHFYIDDKLRVSGEVFVDRSLRHLKNGDMLRITGWLKQDQLFGDGTKRPTFDLDSLEVLR